MSPPVFSILLDHPTNVYQAGELMTGHIRLETPEEISCREVYVRFRGHANVHWSERRKRGSSHVTVHYRSSEEYFDLKATVFAGVPGTGKAVIPPGSHRWPFSFPLALTLPSSFEGQYGRVRYGVSCCVDRPWKFDHDVSINFTVLSVYNLNLDPLAMVPSSAVDSKNRCCLCCKSGPITGEVHLDRQGYVPGEVVSVRAMVTNGTSSALQGVRLNLVQEIQFHARSKTKTSGKIILSLPNTAPIEPGQQETWAGAQLQVPALPPSELVGCSIIGIKYYVQVEVILPMPSINLRVNAPMTIGTIPHQSVLMQYQNMGAYSQPPGMMQGAAAPARGFNSLTPSAPGGSALAPPPPTYAEVMQIPADKDEDAGSDDEEAVHGGAFAPKYTYYNWSDYRPAA